MDDTRFPVEQAMTGSLLTMVVLASIRMPVVKYNLIFVQGALIFITEMALA
jgi:hypothetical protein